MQNPNRYSNICEKISPNYKKMLSGNNMRHLHYFELFGLHSLHRRILTRLCPGVQWIFARHHSHWKEKFTVSLNMRVRIKTTATNYELSLIAQSDRWAVAYVKDWTDHLVKEKCYYFQVTFTKDFVYIRLSNTQNPDSSILNSTRQM